MSTPAARATAARLFRPLPVTAGVAPDVTLVSQYDLDGGSAVDAVGGVNASIVGTFDATDTGSLVQGVAGTSLFKTDGTAHLLLPANNPAHALSELSIDFYYQPFANDHKHILFTGGTDGVNAIGDFSIERLTNGRLRAWHVGNDGGVAALRFFEGPGDTGTGSSGISATNLVVDTAYRITITLGPGSARLYLDGTEVANIPENINGWNNAAQKYLGVWQDGTLDPAQGVLDHLRIWDGELEPSGVAALEPAVEAVVALDDPQGTLAASSTFDVDVAANDRNIGGGNLNIVITQQPADGSLSVLNNGTPSAQVRITTGAAPATTQSYTGSYTVEEV